MTSWTSETKIFPIADSAGARVLGDDREHLFEVGVVNDQEDPNLGEVFDPVFAAAPLFGDAALLAVPFHLRDGDAAVAQDVESFSDEVELGWTNDRAYAS